LRKLPDNLPRLETQADAEQIRQHPEILPLPFAGLMEDLRGQGFVIGTDHYLRVQAVLRAFGTNLESPEKLKTLICPVFAVNEKQQAAFYRSFDRMLPLLTLQEYDRAEKGQIREGKAEEKQEQSRFMTCKAVVMVLLWMLLIGLAVCRIQGPPEMQMEPPKVSIKETGGSDPLPPDPQKIKRKPDIEVIIPIGKAKPPELNLYHRYGHALRWALAALPLLLLFVYETFRSLRRRFALSRGRMQGQPDLWPLKTESPVLPFLKDRFFYTAASRMRQRISGDTFCFDENKSISATLAAGGFPTLRLRPRSRQPEYLVLIDSSGFRDHLSSYRQALARALGAEGLYIKIFLYAGDPRVCSDPEKGTRISLERLRDRWPDRRLLLMGNGEAMLHPVSGELQEWTEIFHTWPERVLLTLHPTALWGLREMNLAEKFLLLPGTLQGIAALTGLLAAENRPDLRQWKAADTSEPVPETHDPEMLKKHLNPKTFEWLCACAVYPELNWRLTLRLGKMICGEIAEIDLLALLRVPGFQKGKLPDELRMGLRDAMDTATFAQVREYLYKVLEQEPPEKGSHLWDMYQLYLAVERWMVSSRWQDRLRSWQEALAVSERMGQAQVMKDYTLLRLLEESRISPLHLPLPRYLQKLFFQKGVTLFGLRTKLTGVLCLVLGAGIFFAMPEPVRPKVKAPGEIRMTFAHIPAGKFMMGSPEKEPERESDEVLHEVELTKDYYMQTREVTVGQWRSFANESGYKSEAESGDGSYIWTSSGWEEKKGYYWDRPGFEQADDHPVTCVSWNDAQAYINWLNTKGDQKYGLPTEAQWEYAVRAGTRTPFYFGKCLSTDQANYDGNYPLEGCDKGEYRQKTVPAGSLKSSNAWGLHDMHGNVWEWCQGWYGGYPANAVTDPVGDDSGPFRLVRGGGWINLDQDCRSANRRRVDPGRRYDDVGFRPVLRPGQQ